MVCLKIKKLFKFQKFRTIGKSWVQTCLNTDLRVYKVLLDFAEGVTSQNTRKFKLQKGEFKFNEIRPIKNCKHEISAEFYFNPNSV